MFRPIKKKKSELSTEATKELLRNSRRGVLAVNGDYGYPYAIPINYFYDEKNQKIYFHGTAVGHKADSIKACDKVCFTVYSNEIINKFVFYGRNDYAYVVKYNNTDNEFTDLTFVTAEFEGNNIILSSESFDGVKTSVKLMFEDGKYIN